MAGVTPTAQWGPEAPQLHADGLVLTAYREGDAKALFAMDRDPEVARRFDWDPDNAALANCEAHIPRTWRWWATGERAAFAVRESVEGPLLATVEARREDDGRVVLSWMTLPGHRGRGLASRAAYAISHWCLTTGAEAVWAGVEHDNEASLRVARSCGMREHHRDSRWVHFVVRGDQWR